jgi:ATP-dependent Clp endopeptidase proteolytic subunit ClpP
MAKSASIFIHGDIIPWQDSSSEDWGMVNLKSVTRQLRDAKDDGADTIDVHIHSNGGDVTEGFAIHDVLVNSGMKVNTIVDGSCYSIATVIFLAGSKRSMSKNSQLMIHNPFGFAGGTADDIEKYADQVRDAENKILDFYIEKTGADRDQLSAMMKEETFIDPSQAVEMKFATEILEPVLAKAKAILSLKGINNHNMSNLLDEVKAGFAEIKNLFKQKGIAIQNAMVKTESGDELEITMAGDKVAVGDTVTKGGENYTGTTTLEDGTSITCEDGKVTAVTEASAASEEDSDTVKDLKAQLVAKDAEIANLTSSITDIKNEMGTITNHLKTLKTTYTPPTPQGTFNKAGAEHTQEEKDIEARRAEIKAAKERFAAQKK